jgi:hypothetical protein
MKIVITAHDVPGYREPSIYVLFYGPDSTPSARYSFSGWRHFFGHFGDILPMTACPIYIYGPLDGYTAMERHGI